MVDFWAAWCGPCRSLAPVLHGLAEELDGAVRLVTVDADQETDLARQYQIRSLPTVKLFKDGAVVDEFMGALPAAQVRAFLEPWAVREADRRAVEAERLAESGDTEAAFTAFDQALADDPRSITARLAYARALLNDARVERAAELLDAAPLDAAGDRGVQRLKSLLGFYRLVDPAHEEKALEADANGKPPSPGALRELAARRVLAGEHAAAMDMLLCLMQTDRAYGDNAAHKDLLAVFDLTDDPVLVGSYRRKLSSMLY